jgi:hypothetical protein
LPLLLLALQFGAASHAAAATIQTDQLDYPPFTDVYVSGSGWQAGETVHVTLYTLDADGVTWSLAPSDPNFPNPWDLIADDQGNITDGWYVWTEDFLGVTFRMVAQGQNSKEEAEWIFTDGNGGFGTTGLPAGTSVTVRYNFGPSYSGTSSETFTTPATSGNINFSGNSTTISFQFPSSITVASVTYLLTRVTISAPSQTFNADLTSPIQNATLNNNGRIEGQYTACDAPTITCPPAATVECGSLTLPALTGIATATGRCGTPEISYSDGSPVSDGCPGKYHFTRTWKATDPTTGLFVRPAGRTD